MEENVQPKEHIETAPVKAERVPIVANFKPPAEKRTIRFADDQKAAEAGTWAVETYPSVFERLAK